MKPAIFAALALAFAALFAGCDSGPEKLKLGVAGPMTGTDATFGAQLQNGVEQAVADINAAGGINGQQIKLFVGDDAADPRQGVSVANNFLGEGIHFVVGHFNSGVTMPASEVYVDNGMLMITPSSTNPTITERKLWNVFRTCGRDDQQGGVAGKYIADHLKDKKVAIVHDKTTYGKGLADETKKAMNNLGVTEVIYEGVGAGEKDFAALVSKLKNAGVEVLYWGGVHTAGGLVLRQMRDQGLGAVFMSGDGIASDEFATIAGPGAEGSLMTFGPDPQKRPGSQGDHREVRGARVQARSLHALQLRRRADPQAGDRGDEIDRPQDGGRLHAHRRQLQHRDRRHRLRREGRHQAGRLRHVHMGEAARRPHHLRAELSAAAKRRWSMLHL